MRSVTLMDVGTLLNRSAQQISRLERGFCRVSGAQLCVISSEYGVSVGWFFHGMEERVPGLKNQVREYLAVYGLQERLTVYEQRERELNEEILLTSFRAIKSRELRLRLISLLEILVNKI